MRLLSIALLFMALQSFSQPGGGGGAILRLKGMQADSARFFTLENIGNPSWISSTYLFSLDKELSLFSAPPWQYKDGVQYDRIEFYQGNKIMRIDIQELSPENPVGWTPVYDSLMFFEGNWTWNLSPYWPLQEDISNSYGITHYTKATWEKNHFWNWAIPGQMQYSPLHHFNEAMKWRRKKEWLKAQANIDKAIGMARNDSERMMFSTERLILLKEMEEWKAARIYCYQLLKKYPKDFSLNKHGKDLAIQFKDYDKADSCYQVLIRQSPEYEWDYLMFLARYTARAEEAYISGKQRWMQIAHEPWEGEPIGVTAHCGVWFQMAKLAELTGHIEEAAQFAFESANRGYGYNSPDNLEYEEWSDKYVQYPYYSLAYALCLHHATNFNSGNEFLQRANEILKTIPESFLKCADYWWVLGLVNERMQDWEKVELAGKKLVKMDPDDMRGYYLLFRFYSASTPSFNPNKSEKYRLKYAALKAN
jgi:tetratricopeptide (TPR) repeat protein